MKLIREIQMYAVFIAVIGAFSVWPPYELVEEDRAMISLVFSHAGELISECRTLTQEELNELPPNMRTPTVCPRERHPVRVELRSGDEILYQRTLLPSGIWADGKANVYERIEVQAGVHELNVGINESGGDAGYDFSETLEVDLASGRNLVVQFDDQLQQILIR
jgi:hypothetical protein